MSKIYSYSFRKKNKTFKKSKKIIKNKKTSLKSKNIRKKIIRKKIIRKKIIGGGAILNKDDFLKSLSSNTRTIINNVLLSGQMTDLESIKSEYSKNKSSQLYDFIYDTKDYEPSKYVLNTIWDHGIGKPDSITAGMKGIHIYAIKIGENNFTIIGKFERK